MTYLIYFIPFISHHSLFINKMHKQAEKVEFFYSESSFGSESNISDSRYLDFTNELVAETENVFTTIRKELQPNQDLNNEERIEYAIRRAEILHKDSLPEQITYLNKITAPENAKQSIVTANRRVGKLLQDYEQVKKSQLPYKDFYNSYGKEFGLKNSSFSRKKDHLQIGFEQDAIIKPEYIQISYGGQRQKLRGSTPRVFMGAASSNDKQTVALKEEVYQLKKSLEETRKKHELERTNERLAFEKRLRTYLGNSSSGVDEASMKSELTEQSEQLTNLLNQNKKLREIVEEKDRAIESMKVEISSHKEQIVVLRKTDSNMEYQEPHNKSYNSETNELSIEKRNEKRIKNLSQENELLKNQLKTERQRLYRLKSDLTEEERRELERSKKALDTKTQQLDELYRKYDQQNIQTLQLRYELQSASKNSESLKKQNQLFKLKLQKVERSKQMVSSSPPLLPLEQQRPLEVSRKAANKVKIFDYEGDGIEGYPYYQRLSKEFRVRFKRSCFREKELLYKANGIEVGVITNFYSPNKISMLIHITNYTEGTFTKLKGKVINANQNKIQGQDFQQENLPSNQQIKIPVSLIISQYPIGPLILLLESQINEKKQEIRMLLPAHIFKTMLIQERSDSIKNPTSIKLTPERKICKDISDLRGHFKLPKKEGPIRVNLFNQHTHNLISADILQTKDGLELIYEHREGNRKITDYFIKTFEFLLSK